MLIIQDAPESCFNDLPAEEAQRWAEQLMPWSLTAVSEARAEHAPWSDVDTTFIVCEKDLAMVLSLQERMVKAVRKDPGRSARFFEERMAVGHFPFFGKPDETLALVKSAWSRSMVEDKN